MCRWSTLCLGNIYNLDRKRTFHNNSSVRKTKGDGIIQYIAVRQRHGHDFLCVDLQYADLSGLIVFSFDSKLCDEAVDVARQEPSKHDKASVQSNRCQVGYKARGCRESTCK